MLSGTGKRVINSHIHIFTEIQSLLTTFSATPLYQAPHHLYLPELATSTVAPLRAFSTQGSLVFLKHFRSYLPSALKPSKSLAVALGIKAKLLPRAHGACLIGPCLLQIYLIYPFPVLGLNAGPHRPSFSVLFTSQARCYLGACAFAAPCAPNIFPSLFHGQCFSSFRSQAASPPHILCILG